MNLLCHEFIIQMKIKWVYTITLLLMTSWNLWSQKLSSSEVPSIVINNFKLAYPKAYDVSWRKSGESYSAEFCVERKCNLKVWYNKYAQLTKEMEELVFNMVPDRIKKKVKENYSKFKIDEIKKETVGKTTKYILKLESRFEDIKIIFNEDGHELSKEEDD